MFAGRRNFNLLVVCWLAASLAWPCAAAFAQSSTHTDSPRAGYEYFAVGDVAAKTPDKTSPGLLLMGGGREIEESFKWFAKQAGHGHIVILRASGDDELQNWIYRDVGGVASVQTLIFHSRVPASDPHVLAIVEHADGIFIAGGDQANYVRFWKGTPLNKLIDAHVRAGKPIGGTSAGLAILGEWGYGAMDGGSITSPEALHDPAGPAVTLVDQFITLPLLRGTVTDTHFAQRDRLGRLLAFVARLAKDHYSAAITGLGVDQDSALLVDANGDARLLSWHPDGHAWIVVSKVLRDVEKAGGRKGLEAFLKDRVTAGKPLNLDGFIVTGIGTESHLKLPGYEVRDPSFEKRIDVVDGKLVERGRASRVSRVDANAAQP
ncbi:MAG TPA: cyanophycinase [Rhodanobacteraceae bacterium]|nr:cyanophycinase [Rhodanobacteraceae bacterium]